MAVEGVASLSADEQAKLAKLEEKNQAANGLTEEEMAKIAEEAEAAEAAEREAQILLEGRVRAHLDSLHNAQAARH